MKSLNELLGLDLPLVLASQSPRRRALLAHVGFEYDALVPDVDESTVPTSLEPEEYVRTLAELKAATAAQDVKHDAIVVGSDTTVVLGGVIFNKPEDANDAKRMLSQLSGKTHVVHTGVALCIKRGNTEQLTSKVSSTRVTFRNLTANEIDNYVASGSPLDKAGAYGIQDDAGAVFVKRVEGCYYTIVGLPLEMLYSMLQETVGKH